MYFNVASNFYYDFLKRLQKLSCENVSLLSQAAACDGNYYKIPSVDDLSIPPPGVLPIWPQWTDGTDGLTQFIAMVEGMQSNHEGP